jgi:hypothetical protein
VRECSTALLAAAAAALCGATLLAPPDAAAQCSVGDTYYDDAAGVTYRCLDGSTYEAIGDTRDSVLPSGPPTSSGTVIPGEGTFLIGTEVAPGLYKSAPAKGGLPCQWWTLGQLGNDESQTGFDSSDGQTYATLRSSDEAFHTQFCQTWVKVR